MNIHHNIQSYTRRWWKESVVYQIYPRSFKDSNNDGIGDLQGIISKLDYLCDLGVDVIWLSPVYKSPNADNGYDISDYYSIMEEFGTMEDMDELINEIHRRGLKLIMDLVVNHTSDEHRWFQESKKSKDNPYRDYYIWRPPNNGDVPNNWASCFNGSCWTFDEPTGEYYFHYFAEKQPDLNWDNPKVREEIYAMMEFWLQKGVDGFRMDVINAISKPENFPDAPVVDKDSFYQPAGHLVFNGPRFLEYLVEMKNKVLSKHDTFTVGETHGVTVEHGKMYTAQASGALSTLFHFEMMNVDVKPGSPFGKWEYCMPNLQQIKAIMSRWQIELDAVHGWNSVFIENHDTPRAVSRFGNDSSPELREASAKMLATWMLLLKGTPFIYQGQEIGTPNAYFDDLTDYRDIETFNAYKEMITRRPPQVVMDSVKRISRDNARTPMQWSSEEFGGFSEISSWIKPNPSFKTVNVAQARADATSVWHYYKRLLEFRKKHVAIIYGQYQIIAESHPEIYAYTRTLDDELVLVICNFFDTCPDFNLPQELASVFKGKRITQVFGNYDRPREGQVDLDHMLKIRLRPYEAQVYTVLLQ